MLNSPKLLSDLLGSHYPYSHSTQRRQLPNHVHHSGGRGPYPIPIYVDLIRRDATVPFETGTEKRYPSPATFRT